MVMIYLHRDHIASSDEDIIALKFADDPKADKEWTSNYEKGKTSWQSTRTTTEGR